MKHKRARHFPFLLALASFAAALRPDLASVDGFMTLLGLSAFRILKTAHAVPKACPAAPRLSCVISAA